MSHCLRNTHPRIFTQPIKILCGHFQANKIYCEKLWFTRGANSHTFERTGVLVKLPWSPPLKKFFNQYNKAWPAGARNWNRWQKHIAYEKFSYLGTFWSVAMTMIIREGRISKEKTPFSNIKRPDVTEERLCHFTINAPYLKIVSHALFYRSDEPCWGNLRRICMEIERTNSRSRKMFDRCCFSLCLGHRKIKKEPLGSLYTDLLPRKHASQLTT